MTIAIRVIISALVSVVACFLLAGFNGTAILAAVVLAAVQAGLFLTYQAVEIQTS